MTVDHQTMLLFALAAVAFVLFGGAMSGLIATARNKLRMFEWPLLAVCFYLVALSVEQQQLQTLFWKLGHTTIGAYLGYWIDRHALGRIPPDSVVPATLRGVSRALIILGAILAVSLGL